MSKNIAALACLAALSACGGGGSGSVAPAPTPTPPAPTVLAVSVQQAMIARELAGATQSFSGSGWQDKSTAVTPNTIVNFTASGTVTNAPGIPTTASSGPLAGTKGIVVQQTTDITTVANGISTPSTSTASIAYSADNGTILAVQSNGATTYFPAYAYPTSAKAGDSGQLYKTANYVGTYTVSAGDASSLVYTETRDVYDNVGNQLSHMVSALSIPSSGPAKALSSTTVNYYQNKAIDSITLNFQ